MFKSNEQFDESMSVKSLNARLNFMGGGVAENRFQNDKLKTLKKALLYSYQAATAVLSDGREFRCLINDDKTSEDYNDKILSIPYKDVCLNSDKLGKTTQGEEEIGIAPGDVFEWKETGTHWLVYLEYLEEDAYFRAQIRLCEAEADIDGTPYWIYLRGPTETTLQWNQKAGIVWNDMNYSLIGYITKTDETMAYFHRFTKLKIDGNTWEVKVVNPYYGDGIIKVCMGEWFNNEMEDAQVLPELPEEPDEDSVYIAGQLRVKPYDIVEYTINNAEGGSWVISNLNARIVESDEASATVEIVVGRSNTFTLSYEIDDEAVATIDVVIESL